MLLNGIHIIDFGNHRNTRLTFGKMNALVGQNGSGKTTVMRAIQEVARAVKDQDYQRVDPRDKRHGSPKAELMADWLLRQGPVEASRLWLLLSDKRLYTERNGRIDDVCKWIPARTDIDRAIQAHDSFLAFMFDDEPHVVDWVESDDPNVRKLSPKIGWSVRYFKANARTLHGASYSEKSTPSLGEEGDELASTLAYLMTAEPEKFARIMDSLRQVVPVVARVRARPAQIRRLEKKSIVINKQERTYDETNIVMGQELIFDMASGQGLSASAVSEGTLVVLAVLTLLYTEENTNLIMLDDIELGLHPKAQRDLIKQLRLVQEQHPELQIIVSTHSPYIVDELKPEEVWLFSTDEEGCAVSARLDQHPDASRALEVLTTGEFWSSEGESWVSDVASAKHA